MIRPKRLSLISLMLIAGLLPLIVYAATDSKYVDSRHWTQDYDSNFKKYTKRYFGPNFDWEWFKAQAIAESGLNPQARSSTGARGLMQILPSTYAEIRQKHPYFRNISDPRWNIAAGIYYDRYLYSSWSEMPESERLLFAFGSYNAGLGGMIGAYKRGGKRARSWDQVAAYAPNETRNYVKRIRHLKNREKTLQAAPKRLRLKMLSQESLGTDATVN